jgi:RNA polymerase sigma factor FliA
MHRNVSGSASRAVPGLENVVTEPCLNEKLNQEPEASQEAKGKPHGGKELPKPAIFKKREKTTMQCLEREGSNLKESSQPRRARKAVRSEGAAGSVAVRNAESSFQRLVQDHLPLVRSIVERMRRKLPGTLEAEELHSIGLSGLVEAAHRYQPTAEGSFAGYAAPRIQGAILDELRRMDSMSRGNRAKARRLGSAMNKLRQEQGANYSQEALCAEMNLSAEELTALMEDVKPVKFLSLDWVDTESDFEEESLHELIADDGCVSAFDALERKELILLLAERMAQLPDLQKKVLAMYYYENMQLAQIAEVFGLTESRICQIRGQAVEGLRKYLTRLLG